MKGISPFVAAILLIALTVAVGGLLAVWFSTVTSSQTQTVSASAGQLAKCASSSLTINEVRYSSDGTSSLVNVTTSSAGSQSLKNITISISGGGATSNSIRYYNASGEELPPGGVISASIDTTGGALVPPEIVSVSGICQGQYAISTSCKSGESCMRPS
jgi:flagellin-like protein